MATIPSNKRQRTAEQSLNISNLPDGILANVASYLAQPSRALFAVATAPSKSWTRDNFSIGSKHQQTVAAILSSDEWEELDFEDIEKSLAVKLTDDDIHAVLKCISAQDVLKKLKLTGCINITGRGLKVLGGSTVIEHIDLSLAKQFESPQLDPESKISEEVVIPILESIISDSNSLEKIVFPKKWHTAKTTEFAELLRKYNQLLERRERNQPFLFGYTRSEWDRMVLDQNNGRIVHLYNNNSTKPTTKIMKYNHDKTALVYEDYKPKIKNVKLD